MMKYTLGRRQDEALPFGCDGCYTEEVATHEWHYYEAGQMILCKKCWRRVRAYEIVRLAKRKCAFNLW